MTPIVPRPTSVNAAAALVPRRHTGGHPDAVEVAARDGQRRRQTRPQLGDQLGVPGPVLRHARPSSAARGSPPAPTSTPNDRRQVLRRPRQQVLVADVAGERVAEPAERQPHQLHVAAPSPLARRQRHRLRVQPFSAGDQHARLLGQRRPARQRQHHQRRRRRLNAAAPPPPTAARHRSISRGSRGAGTASTTPSACQCPPSSSTSVPAAAVAADLLHADLHPVERRPPDQRVEQHRVAAVDGPEHRPAHRRRQRLANRVGEAARATIERGRQRRCGRTQPDGRRRAGVDPGQQRIDRPGHHLRAEPVADQLGDRRVRAGAPRQRPRAVRRRSAPPSRRRPARPSTTPEPGCPAACPAASGAAGPRCRSAAARPSCRSACRPAPTRPAAPAPPGAARRTPRRRRPPTDRRCARCAAPRRAGRPGRTA